MLTTLKMCLPLAGFLIALGGCSIAPPPAASSGSPAGSHSDTAVTYGAGFYPVEKNENGSTWRWMEGEGHIALKNSGHDMVLTINGRTPEQLPQLPTVTITLNGEPLDQLPASRAVNKRYEITAARLGSRTTSDVTIATTATLIPSESQPGNPDQRRLGFVLDNLTWEPK